MVYDFDTPVERRGSDSLKWRVAENELPMWVADMDFRTAPPILQAMQERLNHGVFGYGTIPQAWRDACLHWWQRRYGWRMDREGLFFCTGVIPAVSALLRELTEPGDQVLVQTPVYNTFFHCIEQNRCRRVESPLLLQDGVYSMDFADLERKLGEPETKVMILCNPHNPIGKCWDRETLERVGAMAKRNHVTVLSDEIHCDLTEPGRHYIPFASVSQDCSEVNITCLAPTKTFNLAGLHTAAVYGADPALRERISAAMDTFGLSMPNAFAAAAAIAAYEEGEDWLEQLREYVFENRRTVEAFLDRELPRVRAIRSDATYLVWLDVSAFPGTGREIAAFLRRETGLFLIGGNAYGTGGEHFLRMNIACPRSVCMDGLNRLKRGLNAWQAGR